MDLETLKDLLSEFDLANFLPELDSVLGWIELLARVLVLAGPVLMLLFGLLYLLSPPKEANYSAGYRVWWGMSSLDSWRFTQKLAGAVWTVLGFGLLAYMAVQANLFRLLEPMDMVMAAIHCLLTQIYWSVGSCLAINLTVFIVFDRKGFRRWGSRGE
ncbi:MAG: SdpI family protein [Firmicutes bacterium]|nr:SdpI family protein [Bacillota bacterium]